MKVSNRRQAMDRCGNILGIKYETYIRIWSVVTGTVFVFSLPLLLKNGARGGVVVKALRYKSAGRGFDSVT